jgi:hypothetical protein
MHTNQTHNSLVIESPEFLKLPAQIMQEAEGFNWGDSIWNAFGLPAFQSNFCLTGNQLYFEHGPDGVVSLKRSDFTGQVIASNVVNPEKSENVYVVTLELTFCKGILCESEVVEMVIKPRVEYDAGFKNFVAKQEQAMKTLRSRWFRYLYVPYYQCVKWTTISVVFVVELVLRCLVWCAEKITPIKL